MEDETALSIIDPVTVNMEVTRRTSDVITRGFPDAILSPSDKVLEVSDWFTCLSLFLKLNVNLRIFLYRICMQSDDSMIWYILKYNKL